jgi:hypothetical protein
MTAWMSEQTLEWLDGLADEKADATPGCAAAYKGGNAKMGRNLFFHESDYQ